MSRPRLVVDPVILLGALAGCGGDDRGAPFEVTRPACPDFVHAQFHVWRHAEGSEFRGQYDDWGRASAAEPPDGCVTTTVDNDGDAPGPCGGQCSSDEVCYERECVPAPRSLDIGTLRLEGTDPELDLMPTPENLYGTPAVFTYEPGDEITVRGGGEGTGIEPFAISAPGVSTLTVPADPVMSTPEGDLIVTWDPADVPAEARVIFFSASSGFSEIDVECWSRDTGQLTIPAEYADDVDLENLVVLTRQTIGTAETELGCAMLTTFSRVDLAP